MTTLFSNVVEWILGAILIGSSLGVIIFKKPVHACLSFLLTLVSLAALYLTLAAQFIAAMQILVYAGAILVLVMFVIILFQDAHAQINLHLPKSRSSLLSLAGIGLIGSFALLGFQLIGIQGQHTNISPEYGTVQSLGKALYLDFFFPFEAVILLFLVAVVGALYLGKKVDS